MPFVVKYFDQNKISILENHNIISINDTDTNLETYEFQRYEKISAKR